MTEKAIEGVLRDRTDDLMALPGVVGTALGESEGTPCIVVLVSGKTPGLLKRLPSAIEGHPVEVHESGDLDALEDLSSRAGIEE